MKPKTMQLVSKILAVLLVLALVISTFAWVFADQVYAAESRDQLSRQMDDLEEMMRFIRENYKDDVSYETLLEGARTGIVKSLNDPYSVYFMTDQDRESYVENVSGEFTGVGVQIVSDSSGRCIVLSVFAGGPAEKAGLREGDIITRVNGAAVTGLSVTQISSKLKGQAGSTVKVEVERGSELITFSIVRAEVSQQAVTFKMIEDGIGYIRILAFDEDSHKEFMRAKLVLISQGALSFIVDVRDNPGGYVSSALDIASQLMGRGDLMHFYQQGKLVNTFSASGTGITGMPLVLLVNEDSASASEILAAAWKENKAAILVGTTTYGKGVAQQVIVSDSGKSFKLSTYYFKTPLKNDIHGVGVTPDYVVKNYDLEAMAEKAELFATFAPMTENVKPSVGSVGLNVYGAQQRLKLLGSDVPVTGTMDQATAEAVKAFQKDQGLYPYGVLDFTTRDRLDQVCAQWVLGDFTGPDRQLEKALELLRPQLLQK